VAGVLAAVNFAVIAPVWWGPSMGAHGRRLRVLAINVESENRQYERVAALIRQHDPDVVGVMEVTQEWADALAKLHGYAVVLKEPRADNFGILLMSKLPLAPDSGVRVFGDTTVPTIVARFELDGQPLTLVLTHPLPPVGGAGARARNRRRCYGSPSITAWSARAWS
jgi:endonuclease/exonuclease/phosphatase (EEP) superfamily protein YafD